MGEVMADLTEGCQRQHDPIILKIPKLKLQEEMLEVRFEIYTCKEWSINRIYICIFNRFGVENLESIRY